MLDTLQGLLRETDTRLEGITDTEINDAKSYKEKFTSFKNQLKSFKYFEGELLKTGISPIDDALDGIFQNDLIVIGSGTGLGKTTLSTQIASNIASQNKRVYFFALEAYNGEIADRLFYNEISKIYYEHYYKLINEPISFKLWKTGRVKFLEDIHSAAQKNISELSKENLIVRYPETNYKLEDFTNELDLLLKEEKPDCIIIDHLHYFDIDESKANAEIKKVVMALRNVVNVISVPIILVSHLRKRSKFDKVLCPSEEELHGSSDISKIATALVTIAPAYDIENDDPTICETYFRIPKNRFDGSTKWYLMSCPYNLKTGQYKSKYDVYRLKSSGESKERVGKTPIWCKNVDDDYFKSLKYVDKNK